MTPEQLKASVALKYDYEGAPTVVATGQNQVADVILDRAKSAGVPIVEDPKLAYVLSKVPLGDEIPPDLYRAVAETGVIEDTCSKCISAYINVYLVMCLKLSESSKQLPFKAGSVHLFRPNFVCYWHISQ